MQQSPRASVAYQHAPVFRLDANLGGLTMPSDCIPTLKWRTVKEAGGVVWPCATEQTMPSKYWTTGTDRDQIMRFMRDNLPHVRTGGGSKVESGRVVTSTGLTARS